MCEEIRRRACEKTLKAHLSGVLAPNTPEWPSSTRWFWSSDFTCPDRSSTQFWGINSSNH